MTHQFHHKYLIVDANLTTSNPAVLTGSHNWSNNAENNSDENTIIIYDHTISNIYLQEGLKKDGVNYLRLQLMIILTSKVSIYPNPSNQVIFVDSDNEIKNISVFTAEGKLLKTTKDFNQTVDN